MRLFLLALVVGMSGCLTGPFAVQSGTPEGYIRTWLLCGPFPNPPNKKKEPGKAHVYDHTPPCVGLDTDYLTEHGGETKIVPHAGMTHKKADGTEVEWFPYTSDSDKVVFRKAITKTPNVVAYAYTTVQVDEPGPYLLALGSDEGVRLWLNGDLVHDNLVERPINADDDLIPVTLKKGKNSILVKVEQGWGGWGFILRVVPRDEVFADVKTDIRRLKVDVSVRRLGTDKRQPVAVLCRGKKVGSGSLEPVSGSGMASCTIPVPFPPPGTELETLDVVVDGRPEGKVDVPSLEQARQHTFQWQIPQADPGAVFSSPEFPRLDFEKPFWVENLVGNYSLSVRFYDADYQKVTSAEKPGRYGAVIQVVPTIGEPVYRYITLFRQSEPFRWWEEEWGTFSATLPAGTGIDPRVVGNQQEVLSDYAARRFAVGLYDDPGGAILLAGLHEISPEDPAAVQRTNPWRRNADWWIGLKHKLGLLDTRYLLYLPDDYDKDKTKSWPLVLFLHGSGERGTNVEDVKRHGIPKRIAAGDHFPFIVVSPQCPPEDGWWQPKRLGLLLDTITSEYRVDPDRVYCTGLSMGGYGTWSTAMAYPDRFAAIAPVCGGGDVDDVARIKDVPVWVFHGAKDDTVPVERSQELVDALKKLGAKPKLTIYPDAYHNSWGQTYSNPELYEWLMQQTRRAGE